MFCPKCGAEAGDARFCRACGVNLTIVSNVLDGHPQSRLQNMTLGASTTLNLFHSSSLSNETDLNGRTAISVFGGTQIDLTAAPIATGEIRISVISVFGGTEIFVPDDVAVRVTGLSIFGGVEVRGRAVGGGILSLNQYETPGYAQSPRRLHIDATLIFGGVNIKK